MKRQTRTTPKSEPRRAAPLRKGTYKIFRFSSSGKRGQYHSTSFELKDLVELELLGIKDIADIKNRLREYGTSVLENLRDLNPVESSGYYSCQTYKYVLKMAKGLLLAVYEGLPEDTQFEINVRIPKQK